ncbi:MAG: fasciclin domain-containing protein [Gammaproteobacteria bacterium]|nr:fasciclin domain-containing protein [Gammaproteobacteria bacterium]
MTALIRRLPAVLLVVVFGFMGSAVLADGSHDRHDRGTILGKLLRTDGAQALVAAVLVVDEAGALPFSLAELLGDRHSKVILLAPGNAAFEKLLGLDAGTLNGLSVTDIKGALPGLLPVGVGADEVAAILLKHASLPGRHRGHRHWGHRNASEDALLKKGEITVADERTFPVGIGASGVSINYETTIIKPDIFAKNGVIHFIDTVIVDGLL